MADPVKNFAKVQVSIGYSDVATSIVLTTGHGARLPAPGTDGAFNLVWWNSTDYLDPGDDPNVEIVRCTARTTDTITLSRAQESTVASTKNTAGKTYSMILTITKKTYDDLTAVPGSTTQMIYNNGGVLGAAASVKYSNSTGALTIANASDTTIGSLVLSPTTIVTNTVFVNFAMDRAWDIRQVNTGAGSIFDFHSLTNDKSLTFTSPNGTAALNILVSDTSSNALVTLAGNLVLTRASATNRDITFQTLGVNRWVFRVNNTAEGGANAGSDFQISRYNDAGTILDTPLLITRSSGVISVVNSIRPTTNDVGQLGSATLSFADLFLASGGVVNWNNGNYTLTHSAGLLTASGNFAITGRLLKSAATVASANDVTLTQGNVFDITGTTQINTIITTNWTTGSVVSLFFAGSLTVKNATAGTGAQIRLAGSADFAATANDNITLRYNGTTWDECARTVI